MYKQVVVFSKDTLRKMGKGKTICHGCHASVGSFKRADEKIIEKWEKEGSEKVVLKVKDLKELRTLYKKAREAKLPCILIRDAGLTQLKKGTVTCLGIGPEKEKKIDNITRKLKLL
jgi:PTH2 family peptidyl-tRNA hydrolase